MAQVLHEIERKIIASLRRGSPQSPDSLAGSAGLSPDQVRRGVEWLKLKGLAGVRETSVERVRLGPNGLESLECGLPERRLAGMLEGGPRSLGDLKKNMGPAFGAAMGAARRNGWVAVDPGGARLEGRPAVTPAEEAVRAIGRDGAEPGAVDPGGLAELRRRPGYVVDERDVALEVSLSDSGMSADISGAGGAIDVEADVPRTFVAGTHPLKDVISEIREAFVTLGFTEVAGPAVQPGFWNFDALFTPQDHPARELQDTFYLDGASCGRVASPEQVRGVSASHERGWRYRWDAREARRAVLRTHTTCVTVRHLADTRTPEARVFSLGRVFRNEKPSYKHLVEFHQVEGVVSGRGATLRGLMGMQREFYRMMGITRVKFWPTFFPYTEPSLQTMVYNDRLGKWVELFGMGILRPEVTGPLGIPGPVLAWGGGIERIAMLRYGVDDVRRFYSNDLGWLRGGPRCR